MAHRIEDRTYRSIGELISAVREQHLLTQKELAGRCGLSRIQLCRYEKGIREPTVALLRRVLAAVGLAVTFGVEPSTAALDERLRPGMDAIGLDTWLLADRVVWPALEARVPTVIGGEFAASLQGVPIEEPEVVLYLRLVDLVALHRVVQSARATLGVLGASLYPLELADIAIGDELVVLAMGRLIRVVLVEELPVARLVLVERQFSASRAPIDVPVVPLATLCESGMLGTAAAALAGRLLQRAATPS
ncbi:MAG TPA: helix-turn-helix transcriptional regulator [Pseudonocardiaceae bacterium]|jgi:transcriptional regulator with XRE-family HTH domain|nr:helix-turn-helix transcriptional regulator [Pseudonocardiaceae bacterium]